MLLTLFRRIASWHDFTAQRDYGLEYRAVLRQGIIPDCPHRHLLVGFQEPQRFVRGQGCDDIKCRECGQVWAATEISDYYTQFALPRHPFLKDALEGSAREKPRKRSEPLMTTQETSRTAAPRWEKAAFAAILLLSAALRLWRLDQNGYGNPYYAAAVRSMLTSWHNFFFAAFDPAGFVSVDKPPVALWAQAASAKLLGYSGFSLLLPQALAGVAAVALVYFLVRRVCGGAAGLLAAAILAVTPISVAIDRDNNLDGLLVLVLLLAAWAVIRAAETGRLRLLLLGAALVGVGFNVKMLQAFIVVPTFALLYFLAAPGNWQKRLLHLVAASVVLALVSLSWAVAIDLTPPAHRPYAGGTQDNSELSLIVGYNGLGRLSGEEGNRPPDGRGRGGNFAPPPGGGFPLPAGGAMMVPGGMPDGSLAMAGGFPPPPPGGLGQGFGPPGGMRGGPPGFGGQPGLLRLANREMAGQISWLFPLAAVGLLAAALRVRWRLPLDREAQALLLWGGWLGTCAVVFSLARGIIHQYYLVMLAPALAGIGLVAMQAEYRRDGWRSGLLPVALLLTAAWEAYILADYPAWGGVLVPLLLGGTLIATIGLILSRLPETRLATWQRVGGGVLALGVAALLLSPTSWALTPVLAKGNNLLPAAGPDLLGGGPRFGPPDMEMSATSNRKLVAFLRANRKGARFLLVTGSIQPAAPIIIRTGEPVMATGGFMGGDPILTPKRFAQMVAEGQARYVLVSPMEGRFGGNAELFRWVREHGKPVDPALWQTADSRVGRSGPDLLAPPDALPGGGFPMPPGGMPPPPDGAGIAGNPFGPRGGRMGGLGGLQQLYDCAPSASDVTARAAQ